MKPHYNPYQTLGNRKPVICTLGNEFINKTIDLSSLLRLTNCITSKLTLLENDEGYLLNNDPIKLLIVRL